MRFSLLAELAPVLLCLSNHVAIAVDPSSSIGPAVKFAALGPWPSPTPPISTPRNNAIVDAQIGATRGPLVLAAQAPSGEAGDSANAGVMMLVKETTTNQNSSIGIITTHCLTLISDPSQTFCRTLLDGKDLNADQPQASLSAMASISSAPGVTASPSSSASSSSALTTFSTSVSNSLGTGSSTSASVAETSPTPSAVAISISTASTTSTMSSSATVISSAEVSSIAPSTTSEDVTRSTTSEGATSSPEASTVNIAQATESAIPSEEISSSSAVNAVSSVETITISATSFPPFTASSSTSQSAIASTISAQLAGAIAGETNNESDDYPGQKLSVLPIGLGIFGGLVGIALCIVGYMLYQRRLYRGQFVRRKAEESALPSKGAGMGGGGYGGAA